MVYLIRPKVLDPNAVDVVRNGNPYPLHLRAEPLPQNVAPKLKLRTRVEAPAIEPRLALPDPVDPVCDGWSDLPDWWLR